MNRPLTTCTGDVHELPRYRASVTYHTVCLLSVNSTHLITDHPSTYDPPLKIPIRLFLNLTLISIKAIIQFRLHVRAKDIRDKICLIFRICVFW